MVEAEMFPVYHPSPLAGIPGVTEKLPVYRPSPVARIHAQTGILGVAEKLPVYRPLSPLAQVPRLLHWWAPQQMHADAAPKHQTYSRSQWPVATELPE